MRKELKEANKPKIAVELIGGLGNQLFQLSACFIFAKIHNRIPLYTDRLLDGNRKNEVRDLAVELGINFINSNVIENWPLLREDQIIHPAFFSYFPETNYLPKQNIVLSGYFQNFKIHNQNLKYIIKKYSKTTYNKINISNDEFISLHIRELQASRNDSPLKNRDTLNLDYYKRALEIIESNLKENNKKLKNIYLFSDMFNKNKKNSKIIGPLTDLIKNKKYNLILADNLCSTAWETIAIMSQGKFIISSNSTFSWWAGYLSEGLVISPILSLWDVRLITPESWIQVNDGNLSPRTWHNLNVYKHKKIKLKKRKDNKLLIRKVNHIINFYILNRTIYNIFTKFRNLKRRNLNS